MSRVRARIVNGLRVARTLAGIMLIAAASGCGREAGGSVEPVILRMGVALPSTTMTYLQTSLTRDYLVSSAADGRPIPRLLESWSESDDGLTWRLQVRPGILFHDGSPLTAAVIAPSIENLRTSIFAASRIVSVRPIDRLSLEVRLAERSAFFLDDLAAVYAERVDGERSFGTGPFILERANGTELVLRAFPRYYRGAPEIDQVEVEAYPDLRNAWSALMRSEIDFLYELSRDAHDFVESESSVQVSSFLRPYVVLLGFNPSRPQFRSPVVRRAFNAAVDRDRLVRDALRGRGVAAATHVWPFNWAFHAAGTAPDFLPEKAVALLDEAGLAVHPSTGRMPARLRFKVMCYAPLERFALALQRQLAWLDIDMEIEVPDNNELVTRLRSGDFDAFLFEMSAGRSLKWGYLFWHSTGALRLGIPYDSADAALDRIRLAANDEDVRGGVADFLRALATDPPAVFLAFAEVARVTSRRFVIPADSEDDIFASLWRWQPAGAASEEPR